MADVMKAIDYHIVGLTPQCWHNGQLADPSNRYAVAMKEITSKKKKTEEDYKRLEELEWEGGLYLDEELRVVVPGDVIEGALSRAARAVRSGKDCRAGIISNGLWPLIYPGPKDLATLKQDPKFRYRVTVVNPSTKARVVRTRPYFPQWELKFTVEYFPDVLSEKDVNEYMDILSRQGLSDNRPKFGKFLVKSRKAA